METLKMKAIVSEGGKLLFKLPSNLTGWEVEATFLAKPPEAAQTQEVWPTGVWEEIYHLLPPSTNDPRSPLRKDLGEVDKNGWPVGFIDKYVGCISDPAFRRYPQGEPDPLPPFE